MLEHISCQIYTALPCASSDSMSLLWSRSSVLTDALSKERTQITKAEKGKPNESQLACRSCSIMVCRVEKELFAARLYPTDQP